MYYLFFTYILQIDMFDWFFGSSKDKEQKKTQKKEKQNQALAQEDLWTYDFVKQYLVSPIWRNPLLDFIEQHCVVFEDSQENKFQYTKIHKQFIDLCALLLQSITEQAGIPERILEQCIIKGITDKKDYKIFQQVLLCDNFLAFKKIMVAKNKQLEIAAIQAESQKKGVKISPEQQKIDEKELERLQIEKAIALSLAMEEKMKQQEEKQLEQAIRLSQIEAEKQQKKKESSKISNQSLPPLVIGSNRAAKSVVQFKEEENNLVREIQTLKLKEEQKKKQQQNTEQRKKRLLEQRELIKKKKIEERKQQLTAFVENKPTKTEEPTKVSEEELERRRKLMQRLKQQLKD